LRHQQSADNEDESFAEALHASVILVHCSVISPPWQELFSSRCVSKVRDRVLPAASIDGPESNKTGVN
jgi:hypothetical protein